MKFELSAVRLSVLKRLAKVELKLVIVLEFILPVKMVFAACSVCVSTLKFIIILLVASKVASVVVILSTSKAFLFFISFAVSVLALIDETFVKFEFVRLSLFAKISPLNVEPLSMMLAFVVLFVAPMLYVDFVVLIVPVVFIEPLSKVLNVSLIVEPSLMFVITLSSTLLAVEPSVKFKLTYFITPLIFVLFSKFNDVYVLPFKAPLMLTGELSMLLSVELWLI